MSGILTRKQLSQIECECCGNTGEPIVFRSRCHPKLPTWTTYHNGFLKVTCAKCEKTIVVIEVK